MKSQHKHLILGRIWIDTETVTLRLRFHSKKLIESNYSWSAKQEKPESEQLEYRVKLAMRT